VKIEGWRDYDAVDELLKKCSINKKKTFKVLKKTKTIV